MKRNTVQQQRGPAAAQPPSGQARQGRPPGAPKPPPGSARQGRPPVNPTPHHPPEGAVTSNGLLYPSNYNDLMLVNQGLRQRVGHLQNEVGAEKEARAREAKDNGAKLVSREENIKCLEEMLREGGGGGDLKKKLETAELKVRTSEELLRKNKQLTLQKMEQLRQMNEKHKLAESELKKKVQQEAELKKEFASLVKSNENLKLANEELSEKQNQAEAVLQSKEKQEAELKRELTSLQTKLDQSQAAAASKGKQSQRETELGTIILHLEKKVTNLETQNRTLAQKIETSKQRAGAGAEYEWKQKCLVLESKLKALQDPKSSTGDAEKIKELKEKHIAMKTKAKAAFIKKDSEIVKLKNNFKESEEQIETLELKIIELNKTHSNNKNLQKELDEAKNSLTNISKDYQSELKDSRELLVKEELKLTEFQQVSLLRTEELSARIESLEYLNGEADQHVTNLKKSLKQLEDKILESKLEVQQTAREKKEIQHGLKKLEEKWKQSEVDKIAAEGTVTALKAEMEAAAAAAVSPDKLQQLEQRAVAAEAAATAAGLELSEKVAALEHHISWKTRTEYRINYLSEQLRRYKDGSVDDHIERGSLDKINYASKKEEDEEIDLNLQYLNFLDKDTADIVNELRAKLKDAQQKVTGAELVLRNERSLNSEATSKAREEYDVKTSELKNEITSLKMIVDSKSRTTENKETETDEGGIDIDRMRRDLEVKESEVLWLKSEHEEKMNQLNEQLNLKVLKYSEEIASLKAAEEENTKSAFLQSGVILIESEKPVDVDDTHATKVAELERELSEKKDKFAGEMEIMRTMNTKLNNELNLIKMQDQLAELNGEDPAAVADSSELRKVKQELEKIVSEKAELDVKSTSLGEKVAKMEKELAVRDEKLNQSNQVESLLQKSIEQEQKLQSEIDLFVTREDMFKVQENQITALSSELERTKIKLKEAQEASIQVHQNLFEEHEEILERVQSLSTKKRKRLFQDVYQSQKKRNNEPTDGPDDTDILLNDTIESDPTQAEKDNVGEITSNDAESPSETGDDTKEEMRKDKDIKKEIKEELKPHKDDNRETIISSEEKSQTREESHKYDNRETIISPEEKSQTMVVSKDVKTTKSFPLEILDEHKSISDGSLLEDDSAQETTSISDAVDALTEVLTEGENSQMELCESTAKPINILFGVWQN